MSDTIHPTALVDPSARLGSGVRVGPYAIIEAGCMLGEGCVVDSHAVICRESVLGPRNQIGIGAVIGAEPQDFAFRGGPSRVEIGSGNRIREYVTIHRAAREGGATTIGDDNFLMGGVHLGHDTRVGDGVIMANNTLLAGHVQVENQAFLGGATVVHQHVRIGRLAITRGGTRLGKDVPPYFMAIATNQVAGINRLGLRRAGLSPEIRRLIQETYNFIYDSGLNIAQALEKLRAKSSVPEISHLIDFITHSKRGICGTRPTSHASADSEG